MWRWATPVTSENPPQRQRRKIVDAPFHHFFLHSFRAISSRPCFVADSTQEKSIHDASKTTVGAAVSAATNTTADITATDSSDTTACRTAIQIFSLRGGAISDYGSERGEPSKSRRQRNHHQTARRSPGASAADKRSTGIIR